MGSLRVRVWEMASPWMRIWLSLSRHEERDLLFSTRYSVGHGNGHGGPLIPSHVSFLSTLYSYLDARVYSSNIREGRLFLVFISSFMKGFVNDHIGHTSNYEVFSSLMICLPWKDPS